MSSLQRNAVPLRAMVLGLAALVGGLERWQAQPQTRRDSRSGE
jgi:hypothetical protein